MLAGAGSGRGKWGRVRGCPTAWSREPRKLRCFVAAGTFSWLLERWLGVECFSSEASAVHSPARIPGTWAPSPASAPPGLEGSEVQAAAQPTGWRRERSQPGRLRHGCVCVALWPWWPAAVDIDCSLTIERKARPKPGPCRPFPTPPHPPHGGLCVTGIPSAPPSFPES